MSIASEDLELAVYVAWAVLGALFVERLVWGRVGLPSGLREPSCPVMVYMWQICLI